MNKKNILIVDDEKFVRYALTKELQEEKAFEVESAGSGEEALEKAKQKNYDLFFIDLVMPGMDGVETCKLLKKIKPSAQYICFTGIFDRVLSRRNVDHIEADGPTRLLYKPFRERTFIETAQEALQAVS